MSDSQNFLTCPGAKELPPPEHELKEPSPQAHTDGSFSNPEPVVRTAMPPASFTLSPPVKEPQRKLPKLKRKRGWSFWIFGMVVGLVLLQLVPAVYALGRAGVSASRAKYALSEIEVHVRNLDFESAQGDLRTAGDDLRQSRVYLRKVGIWRDLPWTGTQIRAIEDAVSSGIQTLESVDDLLETARIVSDVVLSGQALAGEIGVGIDPSQRFSDLTTQQKSDMLARFSTELPRLRLARDKMDLANELWARIPQSEIAVPIRSALAPLAETISLLAETLDTAVPLIEVLVPLAGYPEPRRFVALLQNADEIRPSGGFIGNVGTVTFENGDMKEFVFQDVYAIDNPVSGVWKEEPPEPLKRWLGSRQWFLRDANWSPDFPESAERVLDFYIREVELQKGSSLEKRPDTVLALEPGFFEAILNLVGSVSVDGITFDADNFFDQLQFEVEVHFHQQGIPTEQRKDIVSRIGDALIAKIFALPASEWPNALAVVRDAFERKDIMMYSRDPNLLAILDARGWTGRTKATNGDSLWVVDANLAALKTDGAMVKDIRYRLDATNPDEPIATVTLTYKNTAKNFSDFRYTRYRSYTRMYVPEGSELIKSSGSMRDDLNTTGGIFIPGVVDVTHELGKTVFGTFWSVEPGRSGVLEFTYRLPASVRDQLSNKTYHLDFQKQPGVDESTIEIDHTFAGKVKSAVPAEDSSEWGDASYQFETDSLRDRSFSVEL
ncbi:MAG: DUF4012 domain-containing protein [bacterium]|nr:DUF4012 domain-containing protein [bacterium]